MSPSTNAQDFNPLSDIPDLAGKVILITGGNSGLGASTVRFLAAHSPRAIYIAARTRKTADAVIAEVRTSRSDANLRILDLDLGKFDSVKTCAQQFLQQEDRLDVLFLNGGISSVPPAVTQDGYEAQFGTNYMGHVMLMQLLMPIMLKTSKAGQDVRVVGVSSIGAHKFAPKPAGILFEKLKTPMSEHAGMSGITLYGQSKLAMVLFAHKMAVLYPDILNVTIHPGTVATPITRGFAIDHPYMAKVMNLLFKTVGVSPDVGCKTQLWCATAPRGKVENGAYYEPVGKLGKESASATDKQLMERLWTWTDEELRAHGGPGWVQ